MDGEPRAAAAGLSGSGRSRGTHSGRRKEGRGKKLSSRASVHLRRVWVSCPCVFLTLFLRLFVRCTCTVTFCIVLCAFVFFFLRFIHIPTSHEELRCGRHDTSPKLTRPPGAKRPHAVLTPRGWQAGAGKVSRTGCRSAAATPRQHWPCQCGTRTAGWLRKSVRQRRRGALTTRA